MSNVAFTWKRCIFNHFSTCPSNTKPSFARRPWQPQRRKWVSRSQWGTPEAMPLSNQSRPKISKINLRWPHSSLKKVYFKPIFNLPVTPPQRVWVWKWLKMVGEHPPTPPWCKNPSSPTFPISQLPKKWSHSLTDSLHLLIFRFSNSQNDKRANLTLQPMSLQIGGQKTHGWVPLQ